MSKLTTLLRESYNPRAFDGFAPARTFASGTAGALIWMSQLAYETDDRDKIESILNDWGMHLVPDGIVAEDARTVLPMASTRAILASGRGSTILAFAGTDPPVLANWITNFNFRTEPGSTAKGFQQAFEVVNKKIRTLIDARPNADEPLFVTGHSLGGALAVIAARVLQSSGVDVAGVYTYGMPRTGDEAFAHRIYDPLLGARTYRLVHGDDIVPTVAPSALGHRHVGRLLRCSSGTLFDPATLSQPGSDDPQFTAAATERLAARLKNPGSTVMGFIKRLVEVARIAISRKPAHGRPASVAVTVEALPPEIRDHLPDRYINALGAGPL